MPPNPPSQVYWSIKNPSYAPDSSCNRICRAQLFKAEIIENCYAFSNESGLNLSTLLQRKLCLSLAAALCAKSVANGRSHGNERVSQSDSWI